MKLIRHIRATPAAAKGAVIAIGNFDGVHRGHQGVIAEARRIATAEGRPAAVMTFEPHPRALFAPDAPPFRLTPFRIKARLIETMGVDALFALPFTRALAAHTADEFIERVLAQGAGCAHIAAGGEFRFGQGRAGGVETLRRAGAQLGFGVTALAAFKGPDGEAYSSTAVRAHLAAGEPARAAALLGRYHEIYGRAAAAADNKGGLRLKPRGVHLPAAGVYAARVSAAPAAPGGEDAVWTGALAERRPDGGFVIHLLENSPDLAGRGVRLALIERLGAAEGAAENAAPAAHMDKARAALASETWTSVWPAGPALSQPGG